MDSTTSGPGALIDDSVVVWSVPEQERVEALRTRPLLIVMHGYGSHEGDLISLAPYLPEELVVASLRAPLVAPHPIVNGFSWFPIGEPGNPEVSGVERATVEVFAWLDRLEDQVGRALQVGAMGFSQGGAMSLQLLRTKPDRITTAVNLSGFVVGIPSDGDDVLAREKPRVFWGYSDNDTIIPPIAVHRTAEWLQEHSTPTAKMYPGIAHSISQPEIEDVAVFLRETLVSTGS